MRHNDPISAIHVETATQVAPPPCSDAHEIIERRLFYDDI
jgi:hypothetical protein